MQNPPEEEVVMGKNLIKIAGEEPSSQRSQTEQAPLSTKDAALAEEKKF